MSHVIEEVQTEVEDAKGDEGIEDTEDARDDEDIEDTEE